MKNNYPSSLLAALIFISALILMATVTRGQVVGGADVNLSQRAGHDSECAIGKNPTNKLQLFASCNTNGTGMFAARSTDGGVTWIAFDAADQTIADGDAGQGPAACCDPTIAWDSFGNLYLTYIDDGLDNIVTIISTDGGATFNNLASFGPASVDQPTVVAANTSAPGAPVALWIVWNQSGQMRARGAAVTGLGAASVGAFGAMQTIPGTANCSFGDIAIAPTGAVVQTCTTLNGTGDSPENILVNTDADGLGAGNFGAAVTATATNVGGFDTIPAQAARTIDAEPSLGYDSNAASPHFGRLYMAYTDEVVDESNNTDIMLRFSDDNGATWSNPAIRVNDDATTRSQFLPKLAVNSDSGNVAICWHDSRNSATNTAMQEFCAISNRDLFPAFIGANAPISDGSSTSSGTANPGNAAIDFGDYSGLTYFRGLAHPIWADASNSTGNNPNTTTRFDAYTDRVTGGAAANEGDPHITTVNGVHYDFQSSGEFTVLRGSDGLEIQTRQTAISTNSTLGPNGHTGLTTCVSLNSAVAARVGTHRVTYQPNLNGQPDPSGLQLRIDGVLTPLGPAGISLGPDGRVSKAGDGIKIDFPDGTILVVTPLFWSTYGVWYMNVNVYRTTAVLGVMGAITQGTWLPRLPDRSSMGPRPAGLNQRYQDLYEKFADAWRVTKTTSLFDYAPGTSTATFTIDSWPMQNQQCVLPEKPPVKPLDRETAFKLCRPVVGKGRQEDCIFDVIVTGEPGFAKLYLNTERLQNGLTTTNLVSSNDRPSTNKPATFLAQVSTTLVRGREPPAGTVQLFVDGERTGRPVTLDKAGRALFRSVKIKPGEHRVSAAYIPAPDSVFVSSSSADLNFFVAN
jgi:hypothetical protein